MKNQTIREKYEGFFKKEHIGRGHPRYETAEDFNDAVTEYFISTLENSGTPTLSGLVLYLGFSDIRRFKDQMDRGEDFAEIVRTAEMALENYYEEGLSNKQRFAGSRFWLNCKIKDKGLDKGWTPVEKQEVISDINFGSNEVDKIQKEINKLNGNE